jgi:anti-anti-sigma factor
VPVRFSRLRDGRVGPRAANVARGQLTARGGPGAGPGDGGASAGELVSRDRQGDQEASAGPVLRIFTTWQHRGAHVALVGDLDMTTAGFLKDWTRGFTAGRRPEAVCLDLSELRFADIAGFRALMEACGLLQRRSASVELTGQSASLDRIADLIGSELFGQPGHLASTTTRA